MKRINQIMLIVLLTATVSHLFSNIVAEWFEWEHGKEYVIIPYTISYFVGLATAIIGVPMSLVGLAQSRSNSKQAIVSGLNGLASLTFIAILFVWPFVKFNII